MASAGAPILNTLGVTDDLRRVYAFTSTISRLSELDMPQQIAPYREATKEEVLHPLIEANDVIIVAGAFFGDEGKGKLVDAIAKHPKCTIIARTNSGENAGHTVFDETGRKYVFHLAPSGLLVPGKINCVGPECVMDPISFMEKEINQLIVNKIDYRERLLVGNVHIVCPHHKLLDMITSPINSSTLKGMSPIHGSKVTKRGIRLDHVFGDVATMRKRLARDLETYTGVLKQRNLTDADVLDMCEKSNADGVIRIPAHVKDFVMQENKVDYLINLYQQHIVNNDKFPRRADVPHEIRSTLARGEKVLLEGPQSYWLSNAREKFWESSTSADTSAAGLVATAQYNFQRYRTVVINVHKTPASSRVGIGANPAAYVPQDYFSSRNIATLRDLPKGICADFDAIQRQFIASIRDNGVVEPTEYSDCTGAYSIGAAMSIASSIKHGETGATTQKPRVCGLFDCVAHFEVNSCQGPYLSISALDRGDDYDSLGAVIAYVYYHPEGLVIQSNGRRYTNGTIIRAGDPYPNEATLYHCYPIVKTVPGWRATPIAATKREPGTPLPPGVCEFIATVEYFTKAKVISIGNGPIGHNLIYLAS